MKKGFTLIELLVVVLIIGILAAVALPQYTKAVEKSRTAEAMTLMGDILTGERIYHMATGAFTTDLKKLDVEMPGLTSGADAQDSITTKNFLIKVTAASATGLTVAAIRANTNGTVAGSGTQEYTLYMTLDDAGNIGRSCAQGTSSTICSAIPDWTGATVAASAKLSSI